METSIANIVTILALDRLISLGFIYLLVSKLLGGRPIFPQRRDEEQ